MGGIRRAPKDSPPKPKAKAVVPLHRRILGRGATEVDTIDDLRVELERAYELDQIEYDTYLDCHEALDVREAKARLELDKATGRYVKPNKVVDIKVKREVVKPWKPWQTKLFMVVCVLIFMKFIAMKP
ncbi:hypothetical protein 16Q_144 [Pseudomonas phage 16Q]|nr:hypothetical protein 16Q_144 [Pseudomonas phage 16Q]